MLRPVRAHQDMRTVDLIERAVPRAVMRDPLFRYRMQASMRELRELLRIGWRALMIGVAVLIGCLVASQIVAKAFPGATWARVLEESLIIVGWVANWRPIEIYLYDWWPIARRIRLYRRIAAAHVRVKAG